MTQRSQNGNKNWSWKEELPNLEIQEMEDKTIPLHELKVQEKEDEIKPLISALNNLKIRKNGRQFHATQILSRTAP